MCKPMVLRCIVRQYHEDMDGFSVYVFFNAHRYHLLHPEYIFHRIKEQLRAFALTLVLCHVDVDDATRPLGEVTKAALLNGCTLICAWSPEV